MSVLDMHATVQVSSIALLLLAGPVGVAGGQPTPDSTTVDTVSVPGTFEPLLDEFEDPEHQTNQLAEQVASLENDPLDVNEATVAELSMLPALSVRQAHNTIRHRSEQGPIRSLSALTAVPGITTQTVQALRPYLVVSRQRQQADTRDAHSSERGANSKFTMDVLQRITGRVEAARGYEDGQFLGSPFRLTTRVRGEYDPHLEFGLTMDKDPGEPILWHPETEVYGFDHVVGSLRIRDVGPVESFVVGHFAAQYGQGVSLWQGFSISKGRDPISNVLRRGRGLIPYLSASENNYFRGAGATIDLGRDLFATAFASRRARDATPDSSARTSTSSPLPVRTLSTGGLHRTHTERARRGTVGESTIGGALEYRGPSVHVGVAGYRSRFARPIRPGNQPYRYFRMSGRQTSMMSVYVTVPVDNYMLFSEISRSPTGIYGGLLGATVDLGRRGSAVVLGRYYPAAFSNHYGSAFGEASRTQNEIGIYTGLRLQVAEKWTLAGYFDQFRSPWLQFHVPTPSSGWEARTVLEYTPRPWLSTYVQARAQTDPEGNMAKGPQGRRLLSTVNQRHYSARWHIAYSFSDALSLRTRFEISHRTTTETPARGHYLSQGVRFRLQRNLQIDAKLAFFDTDGYAGRIYTYERDLRYSFSVPVFFDRGRRSYVLIRYAPSPFLTVEGKFGVTRYVNRHQIGSGLNTIQGAKQSEFGIQLHWSI